MTSGSQNSKKESFRSILEKETGEAPLEKTILPPTPSLTIENIQNILSQLNSSSFYQSRDIKFSLKIEEGKKDYKISMSGPLEKKRPQFIQFLDLDQLFQLWVNHKVQFHQKGPPKGGLLNVAC